MKLAKLITATALLLGIAGCDSAATSVLQLNGHYDGSVTLQEHYTKPDHSDGVDYKQTPVGTDVNIGKGDSSIVMNDGKGSALLTVTLSDLSDDSVTLQSSVGLGGSLKLAMDPTSQCYLGSNTVKVTLCTANLMITLEIQNPNDQSDLVLAILYRKSDGTGPTPETPVALTLSAALDQARAKSFASRVEFQHVLQAKLAGKAAYLHLLPQISLSTVLNNLTPTWLSAAGAIGDLAPFLIPSRWFQAGAAHQQSKAEQDTYLIMRMDMGLQVEGLFYAYARDKKTRDLTQDMLTTRLTDPTTGLLHQISVREEMGVLPVGSTANMDLIVKQFQQSLIALNQVVIEDLGTISQTLGYSDPSTVTDAIVPALGSLDGVPDSLDLATIRQQAYDRAFERDQIDDLIQAAQDTKTGDYWTFLDPYGDPNLFLSFALPSQIGIVQSQIDELKVNKESIGSIVEQKALGAVTDYAAGVSGYKLAQAAMVDQNKVLNTELETLQEGTNVDFVGLSVILQQYLAGQIAVETATANYRISKAEVDRLLMQGNYAKF